MADSILYDGQVAAAASAVVAPTVFNVNEDAEFVQVEATVQYAAMAGTSGISISLQYSRDNGSTFAALPGYGPLVVKPNAANTIQTGTLTVFQTDSKRANPNLALPGRITNLKIVVTNLDATNAASLSVEATGSAIALGETGLDGRVQ